MCSGGAPGGFMAGRAEPDRVKRHRFSPSTWQERRALIGCRFGGSGESHFLLEVLGLGSGVPIKVSLSYSIPLFSVLLQRGGVGV